MGSIYIYPGMKLTQEEIEELEALDKLPDEEIDYSDIPPSTEEDFKRMWRANPRTPEEWEQYYRWNPEVNPEIRLRLEERRKSAI